MRRFVVGLIGLCVLAACSEATPKTPASETLPVVHFPRVLDKSCRDGSALAYDECGSQMSHYRAAMEEARRTGKVVLVSLGAEWCIWCHVFDRYLSGETGAFDYSVDGQPVTLYERAGTAVLPDAKALNAFAAKAFVLLHLEAEHAPDTREVLDLAAVDVAKIEGYPYIISLDANGKVAAVFYGDDKATEVRREGFDWFRGYDRKALLKVLVAMRDAARKGGAAPALQQQSGEQ